MYCISYKKWKSKAQVGVHCCPVTPMFKENCAFLQNNTHFRNDQHSELIAVHSSTFPPLPSLHSCFQMRHKCWHIQDTGRAGRHVLMRMVIETWWCSWLLACCALLGSHLLINLTCMAFFYRARPAGPGKSGLFTECQGGIVSLHRKERHEARLIHLFVKFPWT